MQLSPEEVSFYQGQVKELFKKREWLVHRIVARDLELIGRIDELKSERLLELTQTSPNLPLVSEISPKLENQN